MALEIAPGILWQRLPLPSGQTVNAWALRDGDGWTVVDCGMSNEPALEVWRRLLSPAGPLEGRPVRRVIGTHLHADHVGMAGWLCAEFDGELWMTRSEYLQASLLQARSGGLMSASELSFYARAGWDAAALGALQPMGRHMAPLPTRYRRIRDGECVRIGDDDWQVLVGSGHSTEHACLYCPARGLLLSGDQVLPSISSNVSVWPSEPGANPMQDWLASLAMLRRVVPDDVLVLPAHHDPFRGLHGRLAQLERKRHRALDRLRDALEQADRRAVDCFETLFGRKEFASVFVQQLATGEAVAYLHYLVDRGEAVVHEDVHGIAWYRDAAQALPGSAER
ncbi:MBL fold metallo-hydrolase [Variovorax jilinensis]|uniref:MBL fold metallo-hydrolase n=1 Tax=Variovorax jilinensis TaxID=3053513 RepID=UPI0025777C65|nr:MBL fold metallo-hydrolase [Variovorax sp. J22P168]